MNNLLALPADALLGKFGSGKHAPGSGSAAALMGLLSAKLVLTVGELTLSRPKYKSAHADVRAACERIELFVVPRLERLFQEDAEIFDRVIQERRRRDQEKDPAAKRRQSELALEVLRIATAIPFEIAEVCLELVDLSELVFDIGFKSARGDTGAALSSAVAGVLASVFVINLNLSSFRGSYWAREQRKLCDELNARVAERYQNALLRMTSLRAEDVTSLSTSNPRDLVAALHDGTKGTYSSSEIEQRATIVQTLIWQGRHELWDSPKLPGDPVKLLDPETALRRLGYSLELSESLGRFRSGGSSYEVAGLLEGRVGKVSISSQMLPTVRRFTAAHELGHVALHPYLKEAHRDRPLDGSSLAKDRIEWEADTFASCFLMPRRLLTDRFSLIFGPPPFSLNDETAFALCGLSEQDARRKYRSRRDLARALARTTRFNGYSVVSLIEQFVVSIEAMAIRLEEVGLVDGESTTTGPKTRDRVRLEKDSRRSSGTN